MSQKLADSHSPTDSNNRKTLDKVITSHNGCSSNGSDSDSESGSDDGGEADGGDPPSRVVYDDATLARFWAKVNKNGPVPIHRPELGQCWLWTANAVRGYGQFVLARDLYGDQRHVYAHRFAYELTYGPLPSHTIKACHHCDRPLCVRPSHQFAGTQARNLEDARRKGRLVCGAHLIKLSDAALADIRARYRPRVNGKKLAAEYGVTLTTILRVVKGTQRTMKRHDIANVEPVRCVPVPVRGELHASHRLATTSMPVSPVLGNQIGAVR